MRKTKPAACRASRRRPSKPSHKNGFDVSGDPPPASDCAPQGVILPESRRVAPRRFFLCCSFLQPVLK